MNNNNNQKKFQLNIDSLTLKSQIDLFKSQLNLKDETI